MVGRVAERERPLIDMALRLHGRHSWETWSVVAKNDSGEWIKPRCVADESIPCPVAGNVSGQAASSLIADMLNAGALTYS